MAASFDFGKMLNDILTGKDNKTFDIGRVLMVFGVFSLGILTATLLLMGVHITLTQYAGSLSTIVIAFAGAIFVKKDTEPTQEPNVRTEPAKTTVTEITDDVK